MSWIITVDNGSTFTDGCLIADDKVWTVKVLTTPYDLMRCFVDVFRNLAEAANLPSEIELLRRVEEVRYSTTSGTNALLVRRGVRVGLVIGADGVEDVYGLRRRSPEVTEAIVGDRVTGVKLGEASGEALDAVILQSIRQLLGLGAQWLVVSLPSAWGSAGEQEFKRRYMKLFPGHLLGAVPVLFSRELCDDPDDERRTATAILNGFLHREMARFLYHAEGWVRERHVVQPLRIMRNDGGCGRVAKTTAVKTLDSGPMGGLSGAAALARLRDVSRMVTVDVGGTSADIGLVSDHRPVVDVSGTVHGLPLSFKFPALRTAALGGGSIFQVHDGVMRIGPESAGALPGPVCFGRGGEHPTLTDAALVAGYLDAGRFAGGAIEIQQDLAAQAIAERISGPLGLKDADAGAAAMIDAFAGRLAEEISGVLARQSWKAADVVLVVFGGSGPLLACLVADRIGVPQVVVPPASASFSALGVGFARLAHEYRAFVNCPVDVRTWGDHVDALRVRAGRDMFGEAVAAAACAGTVRAYDERDGTEHLLKDAQTMPRAFRGAARRAVVDYDFAARDSGRSEFPVPQNVAGAGTGGGDRPVLFGARSVVVPVIDAAALRPGTTGHGPCVLESPYWSAALPVGWHWSETALGVCLSR